MFDVVIVGGGPAGLSAALVLGRCRRRVLVCDAGQPRNSRASQLNGYLTRDGIPPAAFLQAGRDELRRYGVVQQATTVSDVVRRPSGFEVRFDSGDQVNGRMVLLATGVCDDLPGIPGVDECYGITVHHCPYCDGWEVSDRKIAVIGDGVSPVGLALSLRTWSARIVACMNGRRLAAPHRTQLARHDISSYESPIVRLAHQSGRARYLELANGQRVDCDAVFFASTQRQQCGLARQLGCEFTRKGTVKTDLLGKTCVPGIYVVGDASRDVQFVVVAAAEGAKAGVAINKALQARAGLVPVAVAS
ncbi:MAG TPA: NAD(P)/FAD-dependent oxidoreductase [Vicinamibacterales bacterium]|nr:NAD(P)/FAD-dependent oxidoreductase [Vicinamibacterales bacterium]